ncbi:MAG: ATP-binding protein [Nitrospirae bacterium]|nr:MAG: ATP-binding protein [Nitrospirota bacterium]
MNRDALLAVVAEWLEEGEVPPLVPREGPHPDLPALKRILAVVGPRRAGKTYFLYQLVGSLLQGGRHAKGEILFVDFEDYRLAGFSADHVEELLAAFAQLAGRPPRFLFFDEVQQVAGWSRILRTLHNRRRFRIVVSGSSSRLLHREVASELRGRYEDRLMLPFSFREFLRYEGLEVRATTAHTAARGAILAAFDRYLAKGGFPEVVAATSERERRALLRSYYQTIFYRDTVERHGIKVRHLLEMLMGNLLESYADRFSISRFERQLKAHGLAGSKRTISNYLAYLEEAFFVLTHEKFAYSPRKRLMNPKKVYLMDTGFAALGRPFSENRGRLLENVVAVELYRRGEEAYYYGGRHECDFLLKRGRQPVQALQVCWEVTPVNRRRELAGLAEARRVLGVEEGLILTYAQRGEEAVGGWKVPVVPVWEWLVFGGPEDRGRPGRHDG